MQSIKTIVPHELQRVEEEDEEQLARQEDNEDDQRRWRTKLSWPRTPEPTSMDMNVTEDNDQLRHRLQWSILPSAIDELTRRLNSIPSILSQLPLISLVPQLVHYMPVDDSAWCNDNHENDYSGPSFKLQEMICQIGFEQHKFISTMIKSLHINILFIINR